MKKAFISGGRELNLNRQSVKPEFLDTDGLCQGCPMFPTLFICRMEPLIQWLREDQAMSGVLILGDGGGGRRGEKGGAASTWMVSTYFGTNLFCPYRWALLYMGKQLGQD